MWILEYVAINGVYVFERFRHFILGCFSASFTSVSTFFYLVDVFVVWLLWYWFNMLSYAVYFFNFYGIRISGTILYYIYYTINVLNCIYVHAWKLKLQMIVLLWLQILLNISRLLQFLCLLLCTDTMSYK